MRKFILVSSALLLILGWVLISPYLALNLIVEHRLERADAILVLSGSAAYRERTRLAADLYRKGVSQSVVISDDGERAGWSPAEQTNLPFVELARRELVKNGVSPEAVIQLPGTMTGTDSEARALADHAVTRQIRSVLLVTSPYHTRRAYNTFMKVLSGSGIEIGIVSPGVGGHSPEPAYWWTSRAGLQNVGGEYVKSAVYWMFY